MSGKSNNDGRAYEFICLLSLYDAISLIRPSQIIENSSHKAAKKVWDNLDADKKTIYSLSAKSVIDTIFAMEPNILEKGHDMLNLYIQADKRGEEADVRDIIIERKDIIWEIGLSIKHNHMAVKHCRLAKTLDFCKKWFDKECSADYWKDINPVFEFLEAEKEKGKSFNELRSKTGDVYIPLLDAFMREIKMQVENDATVAHRLVEYLLSKYDFYKIISIDSKKITTIQSFNMYGTLNLPSKEVEPRIKVPCVKLPDNLLYIGMKPRSKTTVLMVFDNGWQFSFRIHNANKLIETSLKFDVNIVGMPANVNIKYNCKWKK